jgi:transposase
MHDNARRHTAKHTQKWLKDTAINVMEWPSYSPDLNPIEYVWFLLKEAIYKLRPDILTMTSMNEIL